VGTIQDYLDTRDRQFRHRYVSGPTRKSETGTTLFVGSPRSKTTGDIPSNGVYQETWSINHPGRELRNRLDQSGLNVGGPFQTKRLELMVNSEEFRLTSIFGTSTPWTKYDHYGPLYPDYTTYTLGRQIMGKTLAASPTWTGFSGMNTLDLRKKGEQIMLSLVPTSAAFDAATSIGELLADGTLFAVPGRSVMDGDIGGEYLNTVFGVIPTQGDLSDLHKAVSSYDSIIKQYYRDANKRIRRKTRPFALPETVDVVVKTNQPPIDGAGNALIAYLAGSSTTTITTRTNQEVWYAGAFRYYVPESMSIFERKFTEWNRVYGIGLDPASMWNLFPFSWMTDWFTNGEDSLRHLFIQSSEGATQEYGYVMCYTTKVITVEWRGMLSVGNTFVPRTITSTISYEIKQRERVSPFGVQYRNADFTPRQLAILAALGIAK
jgi:hypothetical protein